MFVDLLINLSIHIQLCEYGCYYGQVVLGQVNYKDYYSFKKIRMSDWLKAIG